jgi:hypothetical protein
MEKEFKYYFSLVTGQKVKILSDEVSLLESYQLPLKKKPSNSCKKCYGRGYLHYDSFNQAYIPCKCIKKLVDLENSANKEISFFNPK